MIRKTSGALLLLLAALPLRAQETFAPKGSILVSPAAVQAQADDLHDAVANPSIDSFSVHRQAADMFESIGLPVVRPKPHLMDRESVDGHRGTIDGMLATAKQRYDHYKLTTTEVPPAELEGSMEYAKVVRDQKRVGFGALASNQMGEFSYNLADRLDAGLVSINAHMAIMAAYIGEAFAYATFAHEAAHAKARAEGRLSPERVIDGEIEAYRVQYRWLKVIDPSAERMIVLHSTLNLYVKRHPEDQEARASISYLEHLLQLWDTGGEERNLRDMVKSLGYEEGDKNHGGGVSAAAPAGPRV